MTENKFQNIMLQLDTDTSMDEKILTHLSNFSKSSKTYKFKNWLDSFFIHIPRVVVLFSILIVCSTMVTWAAIKYVKTYPINIKTQIPEENDDSISKHESTRQYFREGEDAFAILELPNLIPIYVIDNYYVNNDQFTYKETKNEDGSISKEIYATFYDNNAQAKRVDISFSPTLTSTKESGITMITEANITTYDYVTKSGLQFSIAEVDGEQDYQDSIIAFLYFDSETLGHGTYTLNFDEIEIEEIKMILDSIPLDEK